MLFIDNKSKQSFFMHQIIHVGIYYQSMQMECKLDAIYCIKSYNLTQFVLIFYGDHHNNDIAIEIMLEFLCIIRSSKYFLSFLQHVFRMYLSM